MFKKILGNLIGSSPLVHNITNYVTVNDCANIVLAVGGSPLMADDIGEVADITSISHSLYINVGTLNSRTIEAMIKAGKQANQLGLPVILDPVGMGASNLRNHTVNQLIEEIDFSVIKGNMSEIKALYNNCKNSGGVDVREEDIIHSDNKDESLFFAKKVALRFNCIVAITGAIDIVTDGNKSYLIANGHPMMGKITGTGCMTGSVIATYCAVNKDNLLEATVVAITVMALSGEMAYKKVASQSEGTGSFRAYLIDYVSLMNVQTLEAGAKIESR